MRDQWKDLSDAELKARLENKTDLSPAWAEAMVNQRDDEYVAAAIDDLLERG